MRIVTTVFLGPKNSRIDRGCVRSKLVINSAPSYGMGVMISTDVSSQDYKRNWWNFLFSVYIFFLIWRQPCKYDTDFRQEQCENFNGVPFMGNFYQWKQIEKGKLWTLTRQQGQSCTLSVIFKGKYPTFSGGKWWQNFINKCHWFVNMIKHFQNVIEFCSCLGQIS